MPKRLVAAPRWTVAAAAACLAAGAFLAHALWWDDEGVEPAQPAASAAGQTVERMDDPVPGFALNPSEDYAEMVERPLFTRTRRPTPSEENRPGGGSAAGEDTAAAHIALNGVLLAGKRRVALLRIDNDPKVMHVAEGQEAGGWLVEAIRPDRVVLRRGETANEIALDFKRKAQAPPSQRPGAQPRMSHEIPAGEDDHSGE